MDKRREKVIQKSLAFPSFFVCKLFYLLTFLSVNLNDQVKTDEFAYWSAEYASKTKKIFENMETKIDKVYEIC